jgi:membrane-associated protease RseP (regulator of RpoE activity)
MRIAGKFAWVVLGVALLGLQGCASYSQTFIGPGGDIKNCASTSQDQGLTGVILASSRFNKCVDAIKALGYKEIESVGTVGISLYRADANGLRVMKVYDNSPAANAGIVRGDHIVAINSQKVVQNCDFAATMGEIGSTVDVAVNRDGNVANYTLKRARCSYSRILEDVTY